MASPDEALDVTCPGCGHRVRVPPDLRGRTGQCPRCERPFTAPSAPAAPASRSLSIPAAVLLVLSLWGLYACAISLAATVVKADQIRADYAERIAQAREGRGLPVPDLDGLLLVRAFLA